MMRRLICTKCKKIEHSEPAYLCDRCGGILHYETQPDFSKENIQASRLGEGNSPLIAIRHAKETLDLKYVYAKCEFMNPTGSFKDRGMAFAIAKAQELGMKRIIVASAGNASASAAAYGTRVDIPVTAIVPESTSPEKVRQAKAYGADVICLVGNYSDAYQAAKTVAQDSQWYNVTTTYINPYLWAGYETICHELAMQLRQNIDWILVPIGAGPLLAAMYHGFESLKIQGKVKRIPRLAGIQSDCCLPIADAFLKNITTVSEWNMERSTIASGMNDELKGYVQDGEYTLNCIYKTGGTAVVVSDTEITDAQKILGREGLYVEPAGAASVAAARKMRSQGILQQEEVVVALLTGSGLKSNLATGPGSNVLARNIDELFSILKQKN